MEGQRREIKREMTRRQEEYDGQVIHGTIALRSDSTSECETDVGVDELEIELGNLLFTVEHIRFHDSRWNERMGESGVNVGCFIHASLGWLGLSTPAHS